MNADEIPRPGLADGRGGAGAAAGAAGALLTEFSSCLVRERSLSPVTVRCYARQVRGFLAHLPEPLDAALQELDARQVTAFMVGYCRDRNTWSAKAMVTALRPLLRFLHVSGRTPVLLAGAGLVIGTVTVLALSAGWALWAQAGRAAAPARMAEGGSLLTWPAGGIRARQWVMAALACGIAGEGCLAAFRFIAGPAASFAIQAQRYYLYIWVAAAAGGVCTLALCWLDRLRGVGLAGLAAPLATLTAVAGFLVVNTALGGDLSVRFVVTVAQAPLALGLLFCLAAALAGLVPPTSRSPERTSTARIRPVPLLPAFVPPVICAAAVSTLLITGRGAIVGPSATLTSASSGASSAVTAARLNGLRYLNTTAPAIEAAYAPARRAIAAAGAAASPGLAAAIIQTQVLPQLRQVLQYTESVRPGTTQLAAIHRDCLAAFQDAITEYTLFAQAFQNSDASAFAQAKTEQRAASAEWAQWQTGLLSLRLGGGIPATP